MKRKFILVGTFRTGSTAFAEQLGLYREIVCGWESTGHLYGKSRVVAAAQLLEGNLDRVRQKERLFLEARLSPATRAIGFRHLFRSSPKWLLKPAWGPVPLLEGLRKTIVWLGENPHIHVIHLVRRDNLAWYRSVRFAEAAGSYQGLPYPESLTVNANLVEAKRRIEAKRFLDGRLHTLSRTNPYSQFEYEAFCRDNRAVVNAALRFLAIDATLQHDVTPATRIQSRPYHQFTNEPALQQFLDKHALTFG
ncbi:MAG: hypothetical protein AAF993_02365 [Pseudomonadota bacterium]